MPGRCGPLSEVAAHYGYSMFNSDCVGCMEQKTSNSQCSSGQLHDRQRGFLATNRVASPCCIRGFCQRLAWSPSYRPCSSEHLSARWAPTLRPGSAPGVSALTAISRGRKLRLQSALQRCAQGRITGGVAELGVKSPL
ncbi:unnamed protein product [Rangifer tarandus platyrhynchus]|uniref:Uncharacterized protein n=2 Tax=Rangifer tarandus platyrhynchus TaxID=3082113 RepID=A0ACB0DUD1_RANTA|nr:unnamed protein product [Rangifer tarandus platyrhynchus]CAI9691746.1 unnamed protein product [Rangifer tarandus platyrhynchus]